MYYYKVRKINIDEKKTMVFTLSKFIINRTVVEPVALWHLQVETISLPS